ncbi:MAG: hypothetical protein HKO68_19710 [Desulfobacterales bacterium]|nr:hypothetical protein [Desulfobacterales bacterium]
MNDLKESLNQLLLILLSIAILMVMVFFLQSIEWDKTLKSYDQNNKALQQKIADLEQELASARNTIADHKTSLKSVANDLKSAREIIGKLEFDRQKRQKEITGMERVLQGKDNEAAKLKARLSEIKAAAGQELAVKDGRTTELQKIVADQKRQLAAAKVTIQRLEESEQALQNEIQAAGEDYTALNKNYQNLLEELAALKKEN